MRKKKKKQRDVEQKPSDLALIVDMDLETFKTELVRQRVNVGTMRNLILLLTGVYNDLMNRRTGVMRLVSNGEKTKEEISPVLESLYAEMVKIELKVTHLKEVVEKLSDVG